MFLLKILSEVTFAKVGSQGLDWEKYQNGLQRFARRQNDSSEDEEEDEDEDGDVREVN
jgi:hypothetical protein